MLGGIAVVEETASHDNQSLDFECDGRVLLQRESIVGGRTRNEEVQLVGILVDLGDHHVCCVFGGGQLLLILVQGDIYIHFH